MFCNKIIQYCDVLHQNNALKCNTDDCVTIRSMHEFVASCKKFYLTNTIMVYTKIMQYCGVL